MKELSEIEKAIHQLIGYVHAHQGYSVTSLAESMGLRQEEWEDIKHKDSYILSPSIIAEIDEYFGL